MSSLDTMFEAFFCVFRYVNERAASVKIDCDSRRCRPGNVLFLLLSDGFQLLGFYG